MNGAGREWEEGENEREVKKKEGNKVERTEDVSAHILVSKLLHVCHDCLACVILRQWLCCKIILCPVAMKHVNGGGKFERDTKRN